MKRKDFNKKLLSLLIVALVIAMAAPVALAADAVAQGFDQTATLYQVESLDDPAPRDDVTVLRSAANATSEGAEYYLTRFRDVFNSEEDVVLQVFFQRGMNSYSDASWAVNAMRYMSIVNADTGEAVAAGSDIQFGVAEGYAANVVGVTYTIPQGTLDYESSYFVILGSATSGNNNNRMLFVPVVYLITTYDEFETGEVDTTITGMDTHAITVDEAGIVGFNRLQAINSGSPGRAVYAVGADITQSVAGQEICLAPNYDTDLYTLVVTGDDSGNVIPINEFIPVGDGSEDFGDIRFTMPNEPVTISIEPKS